MLARVRKKNEQGEFGIPLAQISSDLADLQTCKNTTIPAVLFCQVRKSYVQADLFRYGSVQYDAFGFDTAGGWYD